MLTLAIAIIILWGLCYGTLMLRNWSLAEPNSVNYTLFIP